jgi:hypothetical protein
MCVLSPLAVERIISFKLIAVGLRFLKVRQEQAQKPFRKHTWLNNWLL